MESVFRQSYPNIEYIIIDGASKDATVDNIKRYAGQLAYWVSEPDRGLYDAMNKGLRKASGDYVLFLNAGDTLQRPDTIAGIAEIAQKINCLTFYMGRRIWWIRKAGLLPIAA